MTREEEIKKIACAFAIDEVKDTCNPASKRGLLYAGFVSGAEWADAHPHWISVEDELPPKYDSYLTRSSGNVIEITHYNIDGWHTESKGKVTHWMPFQFPEKGGEE